MSFDKNNDVIVQFGADSSGLKTETKAVETALNDSIRKMERLFEGLHKNIEANTKAVTGAVRKMEQTTDRSFDGMRRSVTAVKRIFGGLAGLLAGGSLVAGVKAFISIADEYTDLESRLRLVTGSTEELAAVQEELYEISKRTRGAYASTADLYTRLSRSTEQLGVSQGELLEVTEAINKALVVSGASSSSAKAALIQLGQGMASGTLRGEELNSVMEQTPRLARMIAEGMGVTVGQLRRLGAEGKITAEEVFRALQSQAGAVDEEFGQMTDTAANAMQYLSTVFKGLIDEANDAGGATNTLAEAIITVADIIEENKDGIINAFVAIAEAIGWAAERMASFGNAFALFSAMKEGQISFMQWLTADAEDAKILLGQRDSSAQRFDKGQGYRFGLYEGTELQNSAEDDFFSDGEAATKSGKKGSASATPTESQIALWQRALNAQKLYYDETGMLRQMSLADELAYWETILQTQTMTAKDRDRIETAVSRLKVQLLQHELKTRKALSSEAIRETEAQAKSELDTERRKLDTRLALGELSRREHLQRLRAFEEQRYDIELQAQEQRIELAREDPNNPVQLQKELNKRLKIMREHTRAMGELMDKMVIEERKQWNSLSHSISQGLGNAFGDWMVGLQGTMGMFSAMLQSMQRSFSRVISDIASKWIEEQLRMLLTKQSTDAAAVASTTATTAATTASKTTEATTVVTANAAEAASGAAASQAAIPIAGPALAAAAFAGTMALVMGAMKLFSASGGFDVPSGVNPLTQLHSSEMVLPARYADVIRGMAEGREKGGVSSINVNINATDAQSVRRLFNHRKNELARALSQAARNGAHLAMR